MTSHTLRVVKNLQVVQVLALISRGMKKNKACETIGIHIDTFDGTIEENPDIVSEFVAERKAKINSQYDDVMEARDKLIASMVKDADDPDLGIKDKLALEGRFLFLAESMEKEMRLLPMETQDPLLSSGNPTDAELFLSRLTGPSLRKSKGVISKRTTETTFSVDLEETSPPDIIDA